MSGSDRGHVTGRKETLRLDASRLAGAVVILVGLWQPRIAAQTDYEITSALQFNFSNPGARSLGMAGALTGLGDDATGAWTNPAGLTNLSRPEVSVEMRSFGYVNLFTSSGHISGSPTGIGVDTVEGLQESESRDRVSVLSFASFVLPRPTWAVAVYRNEAARFKTGISTEGVFEGSIPVLRRLRPAQGELDLDIATYGVSAATRFGSRASLGAGLSIYRFSLDSTVQRFSTTRVTAFTEPGGFFGPPLRTSANAVNIETQTGRDVGVGLNVGVIVSASSSVRFGASFRQGPTFQFDIGRTAGPGSSTPGAIEVNRRGAFHMPDVYAVGALVQPTPMLSLTLDYRRVQYSQLVENFAVVAGAGFDDPSEFRLDDGHEIRGGVEYLFINMRTPVAIRGGVWRDPDHRIRFEPRDARKSDSAIVFRRGSDQLHATAGLGIAFRSLQIDGAVDYSKRVTIVSLSAVARF